MDPERKRLRGLDGNTAATSKASEPQPSQAAIAAALKELLTHLLKQLEKHDTNQVSCFMLCLVLLTIYINNVLIM